MKRTRRDGGTGARTVPRLQQEIEVVSTTTSDKPKVHLLLEQYHVAMPVPKTPVLETVPFETLRPLETNRWVKWIELHLSRLALLAHPRRRGMSSRDLRGRRREPGQAPARPLNDNLRPEAV